jgi:hypothetical protein
VSAAAKRSKPYTVVGLARVKCAHCGEPASRQWSLRPCALGRTAWYPLCAAHDLTLNATVLHFLNVPDADALLAAYAALAQVGAHAERGDALAAPFMGDAVGHKADAPTPVSIPISTAKGE